MLGTKASPNRDAFLFFRNTEASNQSGPFLMCLVRKKKEKTWHSVTLIEAHLIEPKWGQGEKNIAGEVEFPRRGGRKKTIVAFQPTWLQPVALQSRFVQSLW
jgi:hypothetical protein